MKARLTVIIIISQSYLHLARGARPNGEEEEEEEQEEEVEQEEEEE